MKAKRLASVFLAVCLVISVLSAAALAVDADALTDVRQTAWYYDDVKYVTAEEYFVGTSSTTFAPEAPMTRGMFMTVLARVDQAEVDNSVSMFADVQPNCYYTGAVTWAAEHRIAQGCGDGTFRPNDQITREQMCALLQRYAAACGVRTQIGAEKSFTDAASISSYAREAVAACTQWGLVTGYPDSSFCPGGSATRAQAAAVFHRLSGIVTCGTDFSAEQALSYVTEYSTFGIHRTGTDGDIATSNWVSDTLESFGVEAQLQELTFDRFDYERCEVTVGGTAIESFPFWFPQATGGTITAPLAVYDADNPAAMAGKIVCYAVPGLVTAANISTVARTAAESGAVGLIATTFSMQKHPWAQNAYEDWGEAMPLPAVIVSAQSKQALFAAAEAGKPASILIAGAVEKDAKAYNVIGKIDNGADKWVVITTPTSGWFTSYAERGGGVGLFLEFARVVSSWDTPYNFLFMANTGHELNFAGAHASQAAYAPAPEDVELWIHLGSAIGAAEPETLRGQYQYLGFSENMDETAMKYLGDIADVTVQNDKEALHTSELGKFIDMGYTTVGFYGANYDFHTVSDTDKGLGINPVKFTEIGENTMVLLYGMLMERTAG